MEYSVSVRILLIITSLCCLGTGIVAFRKYSKTQSERLFTAGAAMTIVAIGIASGSLETVPYLNQYGFEFAWYFGTFCGYLLLLLNSIMKSAEQFLVLKRWSVITGAAVLIVFALSPILPDVSSNQTVIALFNSLRVAVCSLCFLRYLTLYTSKGTRFSLLLCFAFLFLSISYVTLVVQAFNPISSVNGLTVADSSIRVVADMLLFVAFVAG